ncbi:MAG: tetratricopeptide repeat protein [Nitrospiria bacterium]
MSLFILLFFVLMAGAGYLATLNTGNVVFYIARDTSFELSITSLILFSTALGGVLVITSFGIREVKNLFANWKETRRKKRYAQVETYYTSAVNAYLAKRYRDATSLFKKILVIDPNHYNTLLRLGKIHRIERNFNEAIRLHRKARSQDDQNIEVLLALSHDLEDAERFEEAIQFLNEVIEMDGTNLTALGHLRDLHMQLQQWEQAYTLQEKILKLHLPEEDKQTAGRTLLGIKYELGKQLLQKGDASGARRYFKSAIKQDKTFIPAHIGLGDTHFSEGKTRIAAALMEKSYEMTGNLTLLLRLEDFFIETGEPERILKIYHEAIQKNRHSIVLKFYLGKLYYRLEMIDDAFDTLADLEPQVESFPDLYKIMGNIHVRRGDLAFAIDAFKKSLKLKNRVMVPFYCPRCDFHTVEWSGRCGRCKRWNTYVATPILVDKASRGQALIESSPYITTGVGTTALEEQIS